MLQLNTVKINY